MNDAEKAIRDELAKLALESKVSGDVVLSFMLGAAISRCARAEADLETVAADYQDLGEEMHLRLSEAEARCAGLEALLQAARVGGEP